MKISDFLNNEVVDYASYSTYRAIASYIDGFKNAHRKVIHCMKDVKTPTKVSILAGIIQSKTEYLHGDISGSIVTLTQSYAGTNNKPLIIGEGNFGNRFNHDNSATRYIFASKSKDFEKYINPDDFDILEHQTFEGTQIEPRFYIPTLPLILINGSEGIATGFAQKILPRKESEIIKYFKGEKTNLKPYFKDFKGKIEKGENNNQWIIKGNFKIEKKYIEITEIPVNYSLSDYIKILDNLEDKKIIKKYEDNSDNDVFNFKIYGLNETEENKIYEILKLQTMYTENLTCLDENNKIIVFENIIDLLEKFKNIKLQYILKRKNFILEKLTNEMKFNISKFVFVKGIVDDEIIVSKKSKDEIIKQLENYEKIIKQDGNYDYLLKMPINSLTYEKMLELKEKVKNIVIQIKTLKEKNEMDIWFDECNRLI